ncbi:uroporphyrinogen-III synthase [Hoeflea sp.]|uniref:uroporphyrinogen-III synthase n=1 Tax=Hoeflea sp. TaxID=1940281 RepID=UPI0037498A64
MRVLVTRPEPGASRTAERLRALGHEPVILPLFEAQITASAQDLPPAKQIGGLIATSARAFSMFGGKTAPAAYLELPVYTVGPATAQAARDAGFSHVHGGAGSARDLASTLMALPDKAKDGTGLLYLAGLPRKPTLEAALTTAGLAFQVLETYRMDKISYPTDSLFLDLLSPAPDAVLFYSTNAALGFCSIVSAKNLDESLHSTSLVCLSPEITRAFPEDWTARVLSADHPDEDSLLASLAGLG